MRKNGLCIANVLWLHCWEIREADSLPARKFMKPIADWLIALTEKDPNSYPTKLRTIPANIQTGAQDLGPAPWMDQPDVEIASSPELAIQADKVVRSGPTVYTDASVRNGVCGIGVVGVPSPDSGRSRPTVTPTTTISITIGREETCSILSAELRAI